MAAETETGVSGPSRHGQRGARPPVPVENRLALQPETPSSPYPKSPGLTHSPTTSI